MNFYRAPGMATAYAQSWPKTCYVCVCLYRYALTYSESPTCITVAEVSLRFPQDWG